MEIQIPCLHDSYQTYLLIMPKKGNAAGLAMPLCVFAISVYRSAAYVFFTQRNVCERRVQTFLICGDKRLCRAARNRGCGRGGWLPRARGAR